MEFSPFMLQGADENLAGRFSSAYRKSATMKSYTSRSVLVPMFISSSSLSMMGSGPHARTRLK